MIENRQNWYHFKIYEKLKQGHPQRMRLQRRLLYEFYTVWFPANCINLVSSTSIHYKIIRRLLFKAKDLI